MATKNFRTKLENSLKRCRSCYGEESVISAKKQKKDLKKKLEPNKKMKAITHSKKIIALDCEMVGIGRQFRSALARCSIVNYKGKILFDEFVKPEEEITDYRTEKSGVRPEHMKRAIPYQHARNEVRRLLKDKILVGHSLKFDMKVLNLRHPLYLTRDTSFYVPLRNMAGLNVNLQPSLKNLAQYLLNKDIQSGEHCSVEDARTAMEIYKLVETSWEKTDTDTTENKHSKFLDDVYWPS